jgi:purine nucleoside phosphorylase
MGNAYSKFLRNHFESDLNLKPAVAASVDSLHLGSFHEGLFASNLGAEILVNGIVPEVIVARHAGLSCAAFCLIERLLMSNSTAPESENAAIFNDSRAQSWIRSFQSQMMKH